MAEKTEQQLDEELIQKETERRRRFSKGADTGTSAPVSKPDKEAEAGAPKRGWRGALENITKTITGQ